MTFYKLPSLILLILVFCLPVSAYATENSADLVFYNGLIYTLTGDNSTVEAVVVKDGRIAYAGLYAGAKELTDDHTRMVDLAGNTMIPGLVDAHAHLRGLGKYLAQLKLETASSPEEVRRTVLEAIDNRPPGRWIQGRGWDQNDWQVKKFPTYKDLRGTESHPVYLRRVDGHAAWVNGKAMELCGITRDTPDPDGGLIVRDENGEPTGVFVDNASDLISDNIPEPSPEQLDDWLLSAIRHCNARGLTGIHDAGIEAEDIESLERLFARGELSFRVYCMLSTGGEDLQFAE